MTEVINIFGSVSLIIIFSLIFTMTGVAFLKQMSTEKVLPSSLEWSIGFFLGMSMFISSWCFLESFLGMANISLYLILTVFLIFSIMQKAHLTFCTWPGKISRHKVLFIFLTVIFPALFVIARINPGNFNIDVHLGSGSTILYYNKAFFFYQSNSIPSFSVSIGQSLLASMPLFFGFTTTAILNLCTWTYVNIIILSFLLFGFYQYLNLSKRQAFLGSVLILFGNTALSLLPICVIDSGAPFILGLYAHSFLTVGSFCCLLFFLHLFRAGSFKINHYAYVLLFLVISCWIITSPENIAIGIPSLIILAFYNHRKNNVSLRKFISLSLMLLVPIFFGMTQGGLLSPSFFRDTEIEQTLPGWQYSPIGQKFKINPGFDFSATLAPNILALQLPSGSRFHNSNRGEEAVIAYVFDGSFSSQLFSIFDHKKFKLLFGRILLFEAEIWNGLKLFFFPILGFLAFFFIVRKNNDQVILRNLSFAAFICFGGGLLLAFFPYQNGIKWPFTRFLLPGYVPAQICFYLSLIFFHNKLALSEQNKARVLNGFVFLLCFGQILGFTTMILSNLGSYNQNGEDLLTRGKRMVTTSGLVK